MYAMENIMQPVRLAQLIGFGLLSLGGSASAQPLLHTVAPPVPMTDGAFGTSLGGDGDTVLIGESGASGGVGRVLVYNSSDWSLIGELSADAGIAGEGFGQAVAIEGDIALVGASANSEVAANAGAAYLFRVSTGEQIAKLYPDSADANQYFGDTVAIQDGVAIIGAGRTFSSADGGAVYFYDADEGTLLSSLTGPASTHGGFGSSIAIEGSTMYVGAPYSDGWAGSIHMIDLQTRLFAGQIHSDDTIAAGSALFGTSLAIDDGVLVIGSRLFSGCNGAFASTAYFYDTSTGIQTQAQGGDCYGDTGFADAVFVGGSIAAISETLYSNAPGVVHLYHAQAPEIVHSFEAPVSDTETWFGDAMIVHNGMMIIGAPKVSGGADSSGEVYVYGLVLPCGEADLNTDGSLDFFDVSRFVNRWGYPETDLNGDLSWDFFDVSTFIDLFNSGCP